MKEYGHYINGQWTNPGNEQTFESKDPATGSSLAVFAKGTEADVSRAVEAAEKAFPGWKRCPAPKRGEILLRAASIMRQRKDALGELVTKEMGKVIAEGKGDVQEAIDFIEYISGEGRRLFGETTTSELPDKFCMTIRQPIGVVGCITPWNFPIAVPSWKLGAALISGNTIVFKPATLTPLCAAALVDIFEEAGLPRGVLNFVAGSGQEVGKAIVEDPRIKALSFTGGVSAGREVYTKASGGLKRVALELGSKNPLIVMDDADIDLAIEGILFGAFGTAGQRCTATSRVIIHERVYDETLRKLLQRTKALRVGPPLDPSIDVGPVCGEDQERKILKYIELGGKEGATLLCGGHKMTGGSSDKGFFIEPSIFEATHGMRITREEIFGPVLSVISADGYEQAVKIANDVEYGLSSAIYTQDINTAYKAIHDLETGVTYVNAPTIGAEVHLPFGGVKNTGNGAREAGTAAIQEFTELKAVFIDYSGRLQKAQIQESVPYVHHPR
jgi:acyl-CoA reductase-like NAD-dependent aldehyde dehydrogenase